MKLAHASRTWRGLFLLAALLASLLAGPVQRASANVTITNFRAATMPGYIHITWDTGSEFNNVGFYIQRSVELNGTYNRISNLIPTNGDVTGSSYYFDDQDSNLVAGTTYYYKIQSLDTNNQTVDDPSSASAVFSPNGTVTAPTASPTSATSTPTQTPLVSPTITPTPTNSPTPQPNAPTATRTATARPPTLTPYPTYTPYPSRTPVDNTPTAAGLPLVTLAGPEGPLPTLAPLPAVTVEFATPVTPVALLSAERPPAAGGSGGFAKPESVGAKALRYWPLVLIALVWIGLGAWFFYSYRKLHE